MNVIVGLDINKQVIDMVSGYDAARGYAMWEACRAVDENVLRSTFFHSIYTLIIEIKHTNIISPHFKMTICWCIFL